MDEQAAFPHPPPSVTCNNNPIPTYSVLPLHVYHVPIERQMYSNNDALSPTIRVLLRDTEHITKGRAYPALRRA